MNTNPWNAVAVSADFGQNRAVVLFSKPGGHSAGESTELVKRICDEAIPFLLKEEKKKKAERPWWRLWP